MVAPRKKTASRKQAPAPTDLSASEARGPTHPVATENDNPTNQRGSTSRSSKKSPAPRYPAGANGLATSDPPKPEQPTLQQAIDRNASASIPLNTPPMEAGAPQPSTEHCPSITRKPVSDSGAGSPPVPEQIAKAEPALVQAQQSLTDRVNTPAIDSVWRHLTALACQTPGWAELLAAVREGRSGTIDGAWGSAATWVTAALAQDSGQVQLVVLPSSSELESWAAELECWTGQSAWVFPAWEDWPMPSAGMGRDPVATARLRVLQGLSRVTEPSRQIVTCITALCQPVPPRADLAARGRPLAVGQQVDIHELLQWLAENGYRRVDAVEYPGEFARRGGILDLFPPDRDMPLRVELFADEIESIRSFAVASQRSLERHEQAIIFAASQPQAVARGFFSEYLPAAAHIVLVEPEELQQQLRLFYERVTEAAGLFTPEATWNYLLERPTITISALPRPGVETTVHLQVESVERFSGNIQRVRDELDAVAADDTQQVIIACETEAEMHRLAEVFRAGRLAQSHRLQLVLGRLRAGFRLIEQRLVLLGSQQLFHRDWTAYVGKGRWGSSRGVQARPIDSFLELNEGDYVVHVVHGIARFRGLRLLEKHARSDSAQASVPTGFPCTISDQAPAYEEHLLLEFRDGAFLYVPASRIDLVQKYVGGQKAAPELSRLGGQSWGRRKAKAAEAARDLAAELLRLQALRQAVPAHAFPPDSEWQREFEAAFPYQETPDQLAAIREVKADLEKPRPMDRLLCGDVGFGKTEVALRAAFKVIDNGKQVAVLVPTTILAEQHYRTFSQRLAEYPFVVEVLNRFKTAQEQKEILQRLAGGGVDVIIGTHRLLSADVQFHDLGLVIIDEEQRFGVEHKERLKQLRATVHVLTMTATPIPRTLHSALLGLRDISNLETPPPERLPVETRIIRWDRLLIRQAILREMNRGGQVFFVHNRVHDIEPVARQVQEIVPEARLAIAHGQMPAHQLEEAVVAFLRREIDVLVATTIIESGVDIPNANTIFVNDADSYGLADLHQLRGRVGRQRLRAYAYFIVNPFKLITPAAQQRLKAIEEFTALGAGFQIALRDLEIRGAGNILGAEQSGHIAAVGYELYCQLLENAVRELKKLPPQQSVDAHIELPWPAYLPRDYVPGQKLRIEVYRRLSRLRDLAQLEEFQRELIDRYGPVPPVVQWLLRTTEIRILCAPWAISTIHRNGPDLVLSYRERSRAEQLARRSRGRLKIVDNTSLYLRLRPEEDDPERLYHLLRCLLDAPPVPAVAYPSTPAATCVTTPAGPLPDPA
ncbi:MAG: transcription-repair coupling factor [Gemmataceae bacterium]|nr:transcription-repair coupling factor [Gemmataceae bacterium]